MIKKINDYLKNINKKNLKIPAANFQNNWHKFLNEFINLNNNLNLSYKEFQNVASSSYQDLKNINKIKTEISYKEFSKNFFKENKGKFKGKQLFIELGKAWRKYKRDSIALKNITYKITVVYYFSSTGDRIKYAETYTEIIKYRTRNELDFQIDSIERELFEKYSNSPYTFVKFKDKFLNDIIIIKDYHYDNEKSTTSSNVDIDYLRSSKMKNFKIGYDYLPIENNNIENCAYDYIWNRYSKKIKRCRKCKCKFDESHFMGIMNLDDKNNGISVNEINKFCVHFGIPHYVIDIMGGILHYYKPDKWNKNLNALSYCCGNNHFYPIICDKFVKSLATRKKNNDYKFKYGDVSSIDYKKNSKDEKNDIFIEYDELIKNIDKYSNCNIFITNQNIYDLTYVVYIPLVIKFGNKLHLCSGKDYKITNIYIKSKKIRIVLVDKSTYFKFVVKFCEKNNIKYVGQSMQYCVLKKLDIIDKLKNMTMNKNTEGIFKSKLFNVRAYLRKFNDVDINDYSEYVAIDFRRHYETTVTKFMKEDLACPTFADYFEKYDGHILSPKCMYYLESKNKFPFDCNGIYTYEFVKNVKNKYPDVMNDTKIISFIKCSKIQKINDIKNIIKNIYSGFDIFNDYNDIFNDDILNDDIDKLGKNITRMIIGMFNKNYIQMRKHHFFLDKKLVYYLLKKCNNIKFTKLNFMDDFLYRGVEILDKKKENYLSYIYKAIIDMAKFIVYDLYRKIMENYKDAILINIKTDCLTFRCCKLKNDLISGNFLKKEMKNGDITLQNIDNMNNSLLINYTDIKPPKILKNEWNEKIKDLNEIREIIKNKGSFLNTGLAGTGKTYIINNHIIPYMNELKYKYKRMTPTNISSLLIGGNTIHSSFSMKLNGKFKRGSFEKLMENDYIIIDECSMINIISWFPLKLLKENNMNFIISGDFNQLPPIEENYINYKDSIFLKLMCDDNIYINNYNENVSRYDKKLYEFSKLVLNKGIDALIDDNEIKIMKDENEISNLSTHICITNNRRKYINNLMMMRFIENKNYIKIQYKHIDDLEKLKNDKVIILEKLNNNKENDNLKSDLNLIEKKILKLESDPRQNMYIYEGLPLISKERNSFTDNFCEDIILLNNEHFVVTGIDDNNISFRSQIDNNKLVDVSLEFFKRLIICPGYALTVWATQGLTIKNDIVFHFNNYTFINRFGKIGNKMLYTFVTRAIKKNNIKILEYETYGQMMARKIYNEKINKNKQFERRIPLRIN
jgi:hypothetical protein